MSILLSALQAIALSAPVVLDSPVDVIDTKLGAVNVERLAAFEYPWGMAYLPDGRILVTEKPGRLRIYSRGSVSAPVKGLPKIEYREQGGLMDVAVHPNFSQNGWVYFYFVEAAQRQTMIADVWDPRLGPPPKTPDNVLKGGAVARGRLDGNALRNVQVIWRQTPKTIGRGHFGGRIVFAPDGKLFITSGDRQRFDPAQSMTSNIGKIVRINSDGSIPSNNPFAGRNNARDVWSVGHRNPLGAVIDSSTGKLWINEMGPWHGDELNVPQRGANYGWPLVSNGDNYNGVPIPDHETQPRFIEPMYYWHPSIAPSGMMIYTGGLFPSWRRNIFVGGLLTEAVIRLKLEDGAVLEEERLPLRKRIRDVMQASDGSILLLTDYEDGELLRLTPARER